MPLNADKPHLWKTDTAASVDLYNAWFLEFAPTAFRAERSKTVERVTDMFDVTDSLRRLSPRLLTSNPRILACLRMSTCPPIARDRLIGLAGVNANLVKRLEDGVIPARISQANLERDVQRICDKIMVLLDRDLMPWLATGTSPADVERERAATIIADRLCGAQADPIIRNAQEQRQLREIGAWLEDRGYKKATAIPADTSPTAMVPGTFTFRMNVRVGSSATEVNIPVDVVVQPKRVRADRIPIMIEAKSAGDFANVNKRRKEESDKMARLKNRFGDGVPYVLFLCGYFDSAYLGYEAAEGIDWIWEHRIDDLAQLGL